MKHFTLVHSECVASLGYKLSHYRHETGATLVHIHADTPERAFCAAFRTVPRDSTGVFHILEHSCLSGSRDYPIGSPILYMMKHSMQTYLNAITFQGKTMYPCASCHPGDFENLMRVYLDAVFHPLLSKQTFQREGWHLESGDIKGVVYNEMQGALSGLDSRIYNAMKADLYPDTYQRHCSGGEPAQIPQLTYEAFLQAHRQHYSAGNCVLCLRGDFAPEEYEDMLHEALLDAHSGGGSSPYDVQRTGSGVQYHSYPVSEGESCENKTALVFSYNVGDYEQSQRLFALSLLAQYLMENQNAPLMKALLATGLVQDARYMFSQERQNAFAIAVYNTEQCHLQTIGETIRETIRQVIEQGVDRASLRASLAAMDFATKESALQVRGRALEDFATVCNNLFFGLPVAYGMDPEKLIRGLEEALDTDYYEQLLREVFLENSITACSVLTPKPQAGDAAHKQTVALLLDRLQEEEKAVVSPEGPLSQPDREEDLLKMPGLSRDNLAVKLRQRSFRADGRILYTQTETAGIVYLRYYFRMAGLTEAECLTAKLMSSALAQLSTRSSTVEQLSVRIKSTVGQMNFYPTAISADPETAQPYFMVTVSCLEKNLQQVLALVQELLLQTRYEPAEAEYVVTSELNGLRRAFTQNGMAIAQNRSGAGLFLGARYMDLFGGYDYLQYVKGCSENRPTFCKAAQQLAQKLFCDASLAYVGVTCSHLPQEIIPQLPAGTAMEAQKICLRAGNVAYSVPSGVNCNAVSVRFDDVLPFSGKHLVMAKLLSLGYLWHQIREIGGAYGTFLQFSRNGKLMASSYRDPHVQQTVQAFRGIGQYLQDHDWSDREILGGMIGVVAELINPQPPAFVGSDNEISWLTQYSQADRQRVLEQVCDFRREDIPAFIPVFRRLEEQMGLCSVGNGEKQAGFGAFDEIISVI